MTYTVNRDLRNFEFWSGARDNVSYLTPEDMDRLDDILPDILGENVTETDINDLFRFDFETVCELLGYRYEEGKIIRGDED